MSRTRFCLAVSVLLLASCSSPERPVAEAPKPVELLPAPKVDPREPGSLWSDSSRWNEIFTPAATRSVGESLSLKLGRILKEQIIAQEPTELKEQREQKKEAHIPQRNLSSGVGLIIPADSVKLEAVVEDILPHQILRVSFNKAVKIEGQEPLVSLEGMVRERDIAEDNSVSTDALFNVKVAATYPDKDDDKKPQAKKETPKKTNPPASKKK
jgi:hypothetical protein